MKLIVLRYVFSILLFFLFAVEIRSQKNNYTAFTVNQGLPSNHVYQCVEDNYGFLWIATDEGVARFDGKYFQVFTTANGLPDNEVIQIAKEKSGRIWVNCFKQSPAYFDEVKNRFINAFDDADLAKVKGTVNMNIYALPEGGMQMSNENGSFVFKDCKLDANLSILNRLYFRVGKISDSYQFGWGLRYGNPKKTALLYLINQSIAIDSVVIPIQKDDFASSVIDNNQLYLFNSTTAKLYVFSVLQTKPFSVKVDSITIAEPFSSYGVNDATFYCIGGSGKIYVYNKSNLQLLYTLSDTYLANRFYEDSKGNKWISTVDKGLLQYAPKRFNQLTIPVSFAHDNFISIARKNNATLAGNYYGEVIEVNGNQFIIHSIVQKKSSRQRKIVVAKNDVYTISEDGFFLNYKTTFQSQLYKTKILGKTGLLYNDSTLVIGTVVGISQFNPLSKKVTHELRYKRVMALAKGADGFVYCGSTDGLFRYDVKQKKTESLVHLHSGLSDRIVSITATDDSLIWVATASNGLLVLKHNKLITRITAKDGLNGNSFRVVTTGKPGQIWLGTANGLSIVQYSLNRDVILYSILNKNVNDGLTSNEVNDMVFDKDTIYAATGKGISVIPAALQVIKNEIPVRLVNMTIDYRDTLIAAHYKLSHSVQNIQMQFAAIALNGAFKQLQYRIGKNENWLDITGNSLTLQLGSGNHSIEVRAVDVNGYTGKSGTIIQIDIATPFWKAIWFWLLVVIIIQVPVFTIINQRLKKKKDDKLAKEIALVQTAALEQQALTSLMNPHFMFNALNSIQHYINLQDRRNANRYLSDFASLLRISFEAAQEYFIPLEEELEIITIYLRLEQMRFADKFTYHIDVAKEVMIDEWMIPTMMLQPLLENALLHGIMASSKQGELHVEFSIEQRHLNITITDNGIGIAQSKSLQAQQQHNSKGMALIKKRIAALTHFGTTPITIQYDTAYDDAANPGCKVQLIIPNGLYAAWLQSQQ